MSRLDTLAEWLSQPAEFLWVKQLWHRWRVWLAGDELVSPWLHHNVVHVHPDNEIIVTDGHWEALFAPMGRNSKVSFNGVDISDHVYAMNVDTVVGGRTTLTVSAYCLEQELNAN